MAVTNLWPVRVRLGQVIEYVVDDEKTEKKNSKYSTADYQALRDVLSYAKDEEKTEKELFCDGINCNVNIAREQFITVKEQFDKVDGIQAYHGYLSFKETDISPELAQKIGMEFANEVWGNRFQVVVTTHLNTKHLHCHFVINSVSFIDGRRCQDTTWIKFRHVADRICEKYSLHYTEKPERYRGKNYITKKTLAGMPTRENNAKEAMEYAISHSRSLVELKYALRELGYSYDFNENHKYWTITPKGTKKRIRTYRLGDDYSKERIKERLHENSLNLHFELFQEAKPKARQYMLPTRVNKIKKVGGLYGLYLYYCYRLGGLPKYKKQNSMRVHYLLRDDLIRLDSITEQVTLLCKNHIETEEQLTRFKMNVEKKIEILIADRTHLRNEIRKVNITDERLFEAKEKISTISETLKTLRREAKLCDAVAERSGLIRERVETVLTEEKQNKGKDKERYVQR